MNGELRYEKKCSVCRKMRKRPDLAERLWKSRKLNPYDKKAESSVSIAKAFNISTVTISRHINRHMVLDPERMSDNELKRIAERAENAAKVMEYNPGVNAPKVWDEVIEAATQMLKTGEMKLTANHLLKAAKDKTDYDIKKKNQDMAIQEMMWHFASGEARGTLPNDKRIFLPAEQREKDYYAPQIPSGPPDGGEDGPGTLHHGAAGDAAPSWPSQILEGDDF